MDNIRRKAPAPRKSTQVVDEAIPTQQMDLVNTQLIATQQQLQQLQERYNELSMHHSMLLQELIGVQKTVVNHEHVMQNVMSYLHKIDARERRDSRLGGPFGQTGDMNVAGASGDQQQLPPLDDEPASPLANASKLLSDFNADVQLNYKNLEHMNEIHNRHITMSTPPPDSASHSGNNGNARPPPSATSSTSMGYAKLNGDLDSMVYPVGQTNGIDPMYSEHIHNIPYPMPTKEQAAETRVADGRKKSHQVDPGWARRPQVLLVEDDPTCRKIGTKFLYSLQCAIDSAVSFSLPV